MHYEEDFFSKSKDAKTIIPRDREVERISCLLEHKIKLDKFQACSSLGGDKANLAETDIKWLNAFYECNT